jgi:hypothetical protein
VFRRSRRGDADQPGEGRETVPAEADDLGELDDDELDDQYDEADYDDEYDADTDTQDQEENAAAPAPAAPRAERHDLGDPATWTRMMDPSSAAGPASDQESGPWDGAGGYPDTPRMDFGSLLVPVREGLDIQVSLDPQQGMWVAVVYQDHHLQLQAFAAPKSAGIWDDIRVEIAAEVAKAGGTTQESEGPFGTELLGLMAPPGGIQQAVRFIGVDGPRWFLRGVLSRPAAGGTDSAAILEDVFADVVVVRGDHPAPPRGPLDIRLPDEARQALEQQAEAEGEETSRFAGQGLPNPFERGPEITETR